MEDPAAAYFDCSDRERAAFEAGIKLGTLYHQFVGTPLSPRNVEAVERAMEEGARVQPFVEAVRVRIDRGKLRGRGPYKYKSLTGDMLDVEVTVRYRGATARCALRYVGELRYPLMHVLSITEGSVAPDSPTPR